MSAETAETAEGHDAIQGSAADEAQRDRPAATSTLGPGPDPNFPNWQPDLNGPHWQPTGGPNGAPFSIAIGRPGSPAKSQKEEEQLQSIRRELENSDQIILPDDEEDEELETDNGGPPHRDPIEGAKTPRKIGTTATGWEVWLDDGSSMCSKTKSHTYSNLNRRRDPLPST